MFIVDLLGWWYSRGWAWAARHLFITRTIRVIRFFSVPDLLKTLFSPFRQDALRLKNAPIGIRLQVLGMNFISRIFGFLIRSCLIIIGLLSAVSNALLGIIVVLIWPLLPLSPLVAILCIMIGAGDA